MKKAVTANAATAVALSGCCCKLCTRRKKLCNQFNNLTDNLLEIDLNDEISNFVHDSINIDLIKDCTEIEIHKAELLS